MALAKADRKTDTPPRFRRSLYPFIGLNCVSFLTFIVVAAAFYLQAFTLIEDNNKFVQNSNSTYVEELNTNTLANMARYIEKEYPELHDTERLRAEAGSPWFWNLSKEWTELKETFGFAYIYYIEKRDGKYVFLLSSDIREDYHPEWLHGPVWAGEAPAFVEEAYATGRQTGPSGPTVNEWGTLLSSALPIVTGGKVVGLLGVDYNLAFMENLFQYEDALKNRAETLLDRLRLFIVLAAAITLLVTGAQAFIGYRSVLVPILTTEAEEAAREAEGRLRVMLDTMAFACFFFDENEQPIDCNKRALELYGAKDREDFLANFFTLYFPEYQADGRLSEEKAREHIRTARETGKHVFTWQHRKGDGSPLPVEVTLVVVDWQGGHRIVAYARDLSRLYATEDQLAKVMSMVEGSPNSVIYLNADVEVEYVNPAVCTLTGLSPEDFLNKGGLARIFSLGDFQRLGAEFFTASLENRTVNFDMEVLSHDGGRREFAFSAFPVKLHDGGTGLGLLGRDVTILLHVQRQLDAARKNAERALEKELEYQTAKGNFLSRVSHEMRTPLHAIAGMTEIGKKITDPEEQQKCFMMIENASERLLEIVNNILDLTGIDTGNFDFSPGRFSFNRAMAQVIETIQPRAQAKGLSFVTDIDGAIPDALVSDERRLKQILQNLLSNAVKFTDEGGIVALSAQKLPEGGDGECRVRFEVNDTGIGMDETTRRRLWEMFEQGDNSIVRKHGGLGLGLSLTKYLADMMGGAIKVESESGKGSSFICDLNFGIDRSAPAAGDPPDPAGGNAVPLILPGKRRSSPDLSGRQVLVVDDIEINREILIALLADTGAAVDWAENGEEAVKSFIRKPYDLVLMDIHMPIMNGIDATEIIRASACPWSAVPVISVSADASPDVLARGRNAGMNDHIPKPIEAGLFFATISRWLPPSAA